MHKEDQQGLEKKVKPLSKEERLAKALRDNLKRRKSASRQTQAKPEPKFK